MDQLTFLQEQAGGGIAADIDAVTPYPRPEGACLWGADLGKGSFYLARADEPPTTDGSTPLSLVVASLDDFIALKPLSDGDLLVFELAHSVPRSPELRVSRAHPMTYEQLLQLKANAERRGIQIRLWPQKLTPRARNFYYAGDDGEDAEKNDAVDCHSIALAAERHGFGALQKFEPRPYGQWNDLQLWAFEQKTDMNQMLNMWRDHQRHWHCFTLFESLAFKVEKHLRKEDDRHTAAVVRQYFLSPKRLSRMAAAEANNPVSLWAAVVHSSGTLRTYKGKPPGINLIMRHLLAQKPNHFRAGVARSNLMWHGLRTHLRQRKVIWNGNNKTPFNPADEREAKRIEAMREWRHAMKMTLRIMRNIYMEGAVMVT